MGPSVRQLRVARSLPFVSFFWLKGDGVLALSRLKLQPEILFGTDDFKTKLWRSPTETAILLRSTVEWDRVG